MRAVRWEYRRHADAAPVQTSTEVTRCGGAVKRTFGGGLAALNSLGRREQIAGEASPASLERE